jgi:translation initiation factor 4E
MSLDKICLLQDTWTLYDHIKTVDKNDYEGGTKVIGKFNSIQSFWALYNNIPKPGSLFYQKEIGKPYYIIMKNDIQSGQKREVSAISIFKNDIQPKWEDPNNVLGGDLQLRKFCYKDIPATEYLDMIWLDSILSCIGCQFRDHDKINGIRVVDGSVFSASNSKPLYRIEIWFSTEDVKDSVEEDMRSFLNLTANDILVYKSHGPED